MLNINNAKKPKVETNTRHENNVLELFSDKTPATVNNFPADPDQYNNSISNRVAKDFIIQGAAQDANLLKKSQRNPIAREVSLALKNRRGTILRPRNFLLIWLTTRSWIFNPTSAR